MDGHASVVTLLLDAKADVNHVDEVGRKLYIVYCVWDALCICMVGGLVVLRYL